MVLSFKSKKHSEYRTQLDEHFFDEKQGSVHCPKTCMVVENLMVVNFSLYPRPFPEFKWKFPIVLVVSISIYLKLVLLIPSKSEILRWWRQIRCQEQRLRHWSTKGKEESIINDQIQCKLIKKKMFWIGFYFVQENAYFQAIICHLIHLFEIVIEKERNPIWLVLEISFYLWQNSIQWPMLIPFKDKTEGTISLFLLIYRWTCWTNHTHKKKRNKRKKEVFLIDWYTCWVENVANPSLFHRPVLSLLFVLSTLLDRAVVVVVVVAVVCSCKLQHRHIRQRAHWQNSIHYT